MAVSKMQTLAKLSGSFAVSGLLFDQMSTSSDRVSFVDAFGSVLLPRTAHAYFAIRKSPRLPEQPEKAFFALDQNGRFTKVYPVELRLKTIQSQFEPGTLSFALVRALVVTYAPMLNVHFEDLRRLEQEAEEQGKEIEWDDLPSFNWAGLRDLLPNVLINVVRDTVVGIVKVLLSWGAAKKLDPRLTWKLVKDVPAAVRAKRKFPFYQRPYLVARTSLRGFVIPNLAELLVSSALEAVRVYPLKVPLRLKIRLLGLRVTERGLLLMVNLAVSSTAAGAVAIIYPSVACSLAAMLTTFAADTFIGLPAIKLYEQQRRIKQSTKILIVASAGIVVWSFLPWIWPQSEAQQALPVPSLVTT